MYGRVDDPYITLVSSHISSLAHFIVLKLTLVWLMNVTSCLLGWLLKFGALLIIIHFLNYTRLPVLVPPLSYLLF